jgi:hypothetical protein
VREFYFFLLVVEVPEVPGALLLANVFQFGREGFFGQALSPPYLSLSSPSLDFINAYELWVGKWLISELTSE